MSKNNEGIAKILKLIIAVVFLAGAIFALIEAISAMQATGSTGFSSLPDVSQKAMKAGMLMSLATSIGLLGGAAYLILSALGMGKIGGFVLLAAGVAALILFIIAFIFAADYLNQLKDTIATYDNALTRDTVLYYNAKYAYNKELFGGLVSLAAFGLYPILKGAKKAFFSK